MVLLQAQRLANLTVVLPMVEAIKHSPTQQARWLDGQEVPGYVGYITHSESTSEQP